MPRLGEGALPSDHDPAQGSHRPVIAPWAAASAAAVPLEFLHERQELLAPMPAPVAADAADTAAMPAAPPLRSDRPEESLHPALAAGTAVVPSHAAEPGRGGCVAATMDAGVGLEVAREDFGDGRLPRVWFAQRMPRVRLR